MAAESISPVAVRTGGTATGPSAPKLHPQLSKATISHSPSRGTATRALNPTSDAPAGTGGTAAGSPGASSDAP
eukprot:884924-Prorocentrum_lima.AAC.1